jgi:hypothetical protein
VVVAEPVRAMASMAEVGGWMADGEEGDCGEGREM